MEKTIDLFLTKDHARKLYGLIAYSFREYQDGSRDIGEKTIMSLIHISEALAVLIERSDGMNPDVSEISETAKLIGNFNV